MSSCPWLLAQLLHRPRGCSQEPHVTAAPQRLRGLALLSKQGETELGAWGIAVSVKEEHPSPFSSIYELSMGYEVTVSLLFIEMLPQNAASLQIWPNYPLLQVQL